MNYALLAISVLGIGVVITTFIKFIRRPRKFLLEGLGLSLSLAVFIFLSLVALDLPKVENSTWNAAVAEDISNVKKLLHGEPVLLTAYRGIPYWTYIAEREMNLSTNIVEKLGDASRYTVRFDTNGLPPLPPAGK